jgi:hypothetical protein
MSQSGWVIERHVNSELRYWTGRGVGPEWFTAKHDEAIRFARETDASVVLSWLFDGNGRVAEHEWMDPKEVENVLSSKRSS